MITVDDRIVEEARLFPEEGGVSMTVVARRPIYYVVSHSGDELYIHVEPATLLAAEPTGPRRRSAKGPRRCGAGRRGQQRPGGGTGANRPLAVQGEQLMPKVSMPALARERGSPSMPSISVGDEEKNELVAKGHVTIARAGSLLTADEVRINRDTQNGGSAGQRSCSPTRRERFEPVLSPGNFEDETGELTERHHLLSANHADDHRVEKIREIVRSDVSHRERGVHRPASAVRGAPSWSIAGKSMNITLDGYGLVDRPKLKCWTPRSSIFPYFSFPAKKTRQTGLLSPLYGYSKKRGFTYLQPIYVALNKSVDFTVAPDIATSARLRRHRRGSLRNRRALQGHRRRLVLQRVPSQQREPGRRRYERRQPDDSGEPLERHGRHSSGPAVRTARLRRCAGGLRRLLPARDPDSPRSIRNMRDRCALASSIRRAAGSTATGTTPR